MQYDPMRPIWLQVMGEIETSIAAGARQPGEKLPGGRELALACGITPTPPPGCIRNWKRRGCAKRGEAWALM